MKQTLKVGDRVIFTSNPRDYTLSKSNPIWDGKQGKVTGTIKDESSALNGDTIFRVIWATGTSNSYRSVKGDNGGLSKHYNVPDELFDMG